MLAAAKRGKAIYFDIGTLLTISVVIHFISTVLLLVVAYHLKDRAGVAWWAASDLSFACGFGLIMIGYALPDWLHSLVGNLLIDLGTGFAYVGVTRFLHGSRLALWPLLPAMMLAIGKTVWFFGHGLDFYGSLLFAAPLRAWLSAAAAWLLFYRAEPALRPASTFTARLYLVWGAMLLSRAAWWLFLSDPSLDPSDSDPTTGPALFVRSCLIFLITPSYLWMLVRRLSADLEQQAQRDPLTGIANRRVMWRAGETEIARAARSGKPVAVLMMDLDRFKAINDQWGHKGGDAILTAAAGGLTSVMRGTELLARIGGEEFLALLPETDLAGAQAVAERLRGMIEALSVPFDGQEIRCTVSIGIAVLGQHGDRWESLVVAADKALYQAKNKGRNRHEVAETLSAPSV